jgi:hypothetical protein
MSPCFNFAPIRNLVFMSSYHMSPSAQTYHSTSVNLSVVALLRLFTIWKRLPVGCSGAITAMSVGCSRFKGEHIKFALIAAQNLHIPGIGCIAHISECFTPLTQKRLWM